MDRSTSFTSSGLGPLGYAPSPSPGVARSSSLAASVNRGNSFGSFGSRVSETFTGIPEANPYPRQDSYVSVTDSADSNNTAGPSDLIHQNQILRPGAQRGPLELHDEDEDEYWEDEEEDDSRFVNFSLLSHIAVQLRDKVPRGTHVKGSIPYPRAFTGKDIVVSAYLVIGRCGSKPF